MDVDGEAPNVDALVAELKARVEERRKQGLYPENLEHELHEHQRRIAHFRSVPDLDVIRNALDRLDVVGGFSPERIETESRLPGGRALHETVAKVVNRQTTGVLSQMQEFGDTVRLALRAILAVIEEPAHVHADLVGQIDALFERVAAFERAPSSSKAAVADLRRRVEELEAIEQRRDFQPFYGNAAFEEEFRGTRDELLAHYKDLAVRFHHCAPVLDIGCGRGEFLELLKSEGIPARGVEIDPALVQECQSRGLEVTLGDGIQELAMADDGALGGVVLIQVVEHLTPRQVLDLIVLAYDKVRPGGRVVFETVNPQSLYVFGHAFYVDPTHAQPVHPAYLDFVFRQAGFSDVIIDWRSPPPDDDVLQPVDGDEQANANIERLNRILFSPQDYALIATR
jgi:SAM-dependent methyltransferase